MAVPPQINPIHHRKHLRDARLAAREALPENQRQVFNERITEHLAGLLARLDPRVLAFCWPYRAEPDLRALVATWLAGNPARCATIPVVVEKATPMAFRQWWPGAPMGADRHGIPIPADTPALTPEVVVIPLNAFDDKGYRLGYGGGYFDRTLEILHPPPVKVGVAFEVARVDSTLPQAHDHPMDWIVTEAGVFRPGSGERPPERT